MWVDFSAAICRILGNSITVIQLHLYIAREFLKIMTTQGLYIQLLSIHGLVRGQNLEMGRNADTGGQIKYVIELARSIGAQAGVEKVDVFTRLIRDKAYASDYSQPIEPLSENVRIVRIPCGGGKYIRKELLWPHLDEFVDKTLQFFKQQGRLPDVVHGHYADAGLVALELANFFDVPFVFTGHSLGRSKRERLAASGATPEEMNKKYRIDQRIAAEEKIVAHADLIVTSTQQEAEMQYGVYEAGASARYSVIPPGLDNARFYPYYETSVGLLEKSDQEKQAHFFVRKELERFLGHPDKPLILALSRPVRKKNIPALILAYGTDKELQAIANLAIFAGIRKDIAAMDDNEREVLTELLLLMDKFDLYGKLAIPKQHDFEYEVPELYRLAARLQGVFVNPALMEPFGLTLIEAAASGLPVVATNDGGPREMVQNCNNGILVDVNQPEDISAAIKKVLVDRDLWKSYSINGIEGVRRHYSWEAHCATYLDELHKLFWSEKSSNDSRDAAAADTTVIGKRLTNLDRLFVTDIDDTLIGDDEALARLSEILGENRQTIAFGVATGRTITSAQHILNAHHVPAPDFIISSVGAEIYYGPNLLPDHGWHTHISRSWEREKIQKLLENFDFLQLQEPDTQREFKLSYYIDENPENILEIYDLLGRNRLRANLIHSSGRFLDILPFRASKGKAVRYLCYKWSIALNHVLVAGDSGNDAEMLRGEMLGVVVGNHSAELEKIRGLKHIYFSPHNHAAGILDGLEHYQFLKGGEHA